MLKAKCRDLVRKNVNGYPGFDKEKFKTSVKLSVFFRPFFFTNSDNFSMSHLMDAVILEQLNAIILTKKSDKTFVWTYERHFDISCL